MVTQLLYKFVLDSVDVTAYVLEDSKIELKDNIDDTDTCILHISKSVDAVKIPSVGQDIIASMGDVTNTDTYVFRGDVKKIDNQVDKYIVTCKNTLNRLKFDTFSTIYDKNTDPEAGEYSAIWTDIIEDGGLTASAESSGTSAGSLTADRFVVIEKDRLNRASLIARILNWTMKYDYDNDYVRLEPKGYVDYGTDLVVGTNVYNTPVWNQDLESMRNNITVKGAYVTDTRSETFAGTGAIDIFTLTYTPLAVKLTLDGVLQTLGVEGSTTGYDYTVDVDNKSFTFESTPASGTSIVMEYTTLIPTPVSGKAYDSITKYGLEQKETYEFKDLRTVDDAQVRLTQLLSILKDGRINTTLFTDEYRVRPGNRVTIIDTNQSSFSGEYIVHSIVINYPDPVIVVNVGTLFFDINELFKTIDERIKSLEGSSTESEQIVRQVIQLERELKYERRYSIKYTRDVTEDGAWGKGFSNGITGTNAWAVINTVWQKNYTNELVDKMLIQGNNTYKEYIIDEDFYDSINSTGTTWNSTTNTITIISGGTLYTNKISFGQAHTYFTTVLPNTTGTYTIKISGDGKNTWQTVTERARTAFTSSDNTGVYLQIINDNPGYGWPTEWGTWGDSESEDVTIRPTYDNDLNFNVSGIQISLED